jgi:hypothetical protein
MKKTTKLNVACVAECVLRPWPRNAVALRTAKTGDTIVGVDDRGCVYASRINHKTTIGCNVNRHDVVSCLVKLRVLTEVQRAEWKVWARQREAWNCRVWAASGLLRNAAQAGLRLTRKQIDHLREITGELEVAV